MGLGLGCNGVIQVLIQPLNDANKNGPVHVLNEILAGRRNNVLVTLFRLTNRKAEQPGTAIICNDEGIRYLTDVHPSIKMMVEDDINASFNNRRSSFKKYNAAGTEITAYIEFIPPPVSLVIVGAGNDAEPVVAMASILGWQVTLIDDGRDKNTKVGRFTGTCQLMVVKPEEVLKNIEVNDNTFFLLMTHNFNYDKAMLSELLPKKVRYIGVLGPAKKMERMLRELEAEGMYFDEEQLAALHSPVGLDIGAESPEEIALSMIAEIKAVISGKAGDMLSKKGDVIHPRNETAIETRNTP
jgi:xanthine dehydrogenase accessory factor